MTEHKIGDTQIITGTRDEDGRSIAFVDRNNPSASHWTLQVYDSDMFCWAGDFTSLSTAEAAEKKYAEMSAVDMEGRLTLLAECHERVNAAEWTFADARKALGLDEPKWGSESKPSMSAITTYRAMTNTELDNEVQRVEDLTDDQCSALVAVRTERGLSIGFSEWKEGE